MKIDNPSTSILYPCDVEALVLAHFVRSLLKAMHKFASPRPYFESLGIELPASIKKWDDFDLDSLIDCEGCIISSNLPLTLFENLAKPKIRYETD